MQRKTNRLVLMDLGNPARDVLEECFTVSRVLARGGNG